MNKTYSKTFFLIIVSIFLLSDTAFTQKKLQPTITENVVYLKKRDKILEKAIRQWIGTDVSNEVRYHYNKVDLNGDGKLDAIVFASGYPLCGSGGCVMLIFKGVKVGFQLITEMSVSRPPLIVLSTKTKGWNDLVMRVSGGGIKPFYSLLKFNGKSYPENPTVEPEIPKKGRLEGVEYLSGIERYDTGFLLE
jgi:hypothetical protein